jgi:hypothetical protein
MTRITNPNLRDDLIGWALRAELESRRHDAWSDSRPDRMESDELQKDLREMELRSYLNRAW